ncbi:MAG: hypothetical protein SFY32_00290 [Bacteroidota bacterium]|nr:hypothetical protein [Bacteroidota bacterium]
MNISEIELYEILKTNMGDKEAKNLVEYIESKVEKKFVEAQNIFSTKSDISSLKLEFKSDIASLKEEFKSDIHSLDLKIEQLRTDMERGFKEQLRWIIVLQISTTTLLIALIKFL